MAIFTALLPHKAQNAVLNKQILIGEVWIGNSTACVCIVKDNALQVSRDSKVASRIIISEGVTRWVPACQEDQLALGTKTRPPLVP